MKRTLSRIVAMHVIFNYNMTKVLDFNGVVDIVNTETSEYDETYLKELVNGVIDNQAQIDFIISMNLKKYTLDRLSIVDRSLLEIPSRI